MKHIDEYRDRRFTDQLSSLIRQEAVLDHYIFMEVCGSHTHAIRRHGISSLLPENINLLSGPGCPVCVTETSFIDKVCFLAEKPEIIIAVFGDLIRVPGTKKSLMNCREEGADIRIIFSPLQALDIAKENPDYEVVFPAIGFETTAPSTAVTVKKAFAEELENFSVLSAHKLMPPAMNAVIEEGVSIHGYICPGHVSAITGSHIYSKFPRRFRVGTVVAGFEPVDILQAILMLLRQVNTGDFKTEIQYKRAVDQKGNIKAQQAIEQVFEKCDAHWRGFGNLPRSGLRLKKQFQTMNADKRFRLETPVYENEEEKNCICGEILKGKLQPKDCLLFSNACKPEHPKGACMVSPEGSCNAHYKYKEY